MLPIYIFDLDGTLADISHRLHYIQGETKDWPTFFSQCDEDAPIWPVINTLKRLAEKSDIWIFTGRSDEVRSKTITWLTHYGIRFDKLLMRKAGDHRLDHVLKEEWLKENNTHLLIGVFEDRQSVVDMWRANGVFCFQVAEGKF